MILARPALTLPASDALSARSSEAAVSGSSLFCRPLRAASSSEERAPESTSSSSSLERPAESLRKSSRVCGEVLAWDEVFEFIMDYLLPAAGACADDHSESGLGGRDQAKSSKKDSWPRYRIYFPAMLRRRPQSSVSQPSMLLR